jgi:hypothetical protein
VSSSPVRSISPNESVCTREITDASKIAVAIKAGHTIAGVSIRKQEALAEVNVEDAMKAFWNSEDTISGAPSQDWDLFVWSDHFKQTALRLTSSPW